MDEIDAIRHKMKTLFDAEDAEGLDRIYSVLNDLMAQLSVFRGMLADPDEDPPMEVDPWLLRMHADDKLFEAENALFEAECDLENARLDAEIHAQGDDDLECDEFKPRFKEEEEDD